MAKMSKKELRGDTFLTNVLKAWEFVQKHQNKFFAGLIAIIIIVAGSVYFINYQKGQRKQAMDYYSEALASFKNWDMQTANELFSRVSEDYGDTREGIYSIYFLGKCALAMGNNSRALDEFEIYRKECGEYDFFQKAAIAGKATALENLRRYQEAGNVFMDLAGNTDDDDFRKEYYLRRAATNYEKAGKNELAVDALSSLMEHTAGTEQRKIEAKIKILKG